MQIQMVDDARRRAEERADEIETRAAEHEDPRQMRETEASGHSTMMNILIMAIAAKGASNEQSPSI